MFGMDYKFSIRFGKEQSPDYNAVLAYASKFRMYLPAKEGFPTHVIETGSQEVADKFEVFCKLMDAIYDWDSAKLVQEGKQLLPSEFKLPEKKEISLCYQRYLAAEDKDKYCDDKKPACWGCRKLTGIVLRHEKTVYTNKARFWYQYGAFIDPRTWRINRDELIRALEDIQEEKQLGFCPAFEYAFFRRYVAALPVLIHLPDPRNWEFVYGEEAINSSKHWDPIGIMHVPPTKDGLKEQLSWNSERPGEKIKDDNSTDAKYIRYVPTTTFADIGGVDEIIQNIRIVIEMPIKKPEVFEYLGIQPYRGILLWGDPGNGKTLIAKAIAHEVNAHFIPVSSPDILNKNFGQSEQNLRRIFEEAREFQPSVIFIDEIDSIAQTRLSGETSKWYATLVNQLLALMDGIKDFGNVTVLAATNRPDLLDTALLRPGRFDYKLEIKKPNLPACKKVIEIATRGMPLADDVDLFAFSEAAVGYSAAEITFLAKEAAMVRLRKALEANQISMNENSDEDLSFLKIDMSDFNSALHILKWNRRYVNLTYSLKDKKLT
jgi:transitional endoplasmic reticulum ATPase